MDYTISRSIGGDPYHVEVIRGALTRNIAACFADVQDEIRAAFTDHIPMTEGMKLSSIADGGARLTLLQTGSKFRHTKWPCKLYAERVTGCSSDFLFVST